MPDDPPRYVSVIPALRVWSIPRSLRFWRLLGFELAFAYAGGEPCGAERLADATFARLDAPSEHPVSVFLDTERGRRGAPVHLVLASPADVDRAAARLAAAHIRLDQPPTDQPWGMRDLEVADPDGNVLVLGAATS